MSIDKSKRVPGGSLDRGLVARPLLLPLPRKLILGSLATAAFSLTLLSAAQAQMMTATPGIGSCSGTNLINGQAIAATTQLSVDGTLIPASLAGGVFNLAECQCQSRDINIHFVPTQIVGPGPVPAAEMFIGESTCSEPSMRSTKQCDKVTDTKLPNLLNGAKFQSSSQFDVTVPPEVVTTPTLPGAMPSYMCKANSVQNYTITVTVGPDMASDACTMPVVVNTLGPPAPDSVSVTSGDSALTVNWNVPSSTAGAIQYYQVLCRKTSDPTNPAMTEDFLTTTMSWFSVCINPLMMNSHLFRRAYEGLNLSSTDPATTTSLAKYPIAPPTMGSPFPLDPRLRCTDKITSSTNQGTARITHLANGESYDVMVVAIDAFGNATGSMVSSGTPAPTVGLIEELCDGANCPTFGCKATSGVSTGVGAGMAFLGGLWLLARWARRMA